MKLNSHFTEIPNENLISFVNRNKNVRNMSFNFIGGFPEDYSPRDSLSESSEELRGGDLRGEVSIYMILVNGVCAIRYISVEGCC